MYEHNISVWNVRLLCWNVNISELVDKENATVSVLHSANSADFIDVWHENCLGCRVSRFVRTFIFLIVFALIETCKNSHKYKGLTQKCPSINILYLN